MMCYRDKTFCTFYTCMNWGSWCSSSLTEEVKKKADQWWGRGPGKAPICTYIDRPDCYLDWDGEEGMK